MARMEVVDEIVNIVLTKVVDRISVVAKSANGIEVVVL